MFGYGRCITTAGKAGFCPICAVNISVAHDKNLRQRIKMELEGKPNTGRQKYDQGLINRIDWKKEEFSHTSCIRIRH